MWPAKDKHKGAKGPGYEFWGRRPMNGNCGPWAKTKTHRIERRRNDRLARKELVAFRTMPACPDDDC